MESDSITESFFYVEDVMEGEETIYQLSHHNCTWFSITVLKYVVKER